MAALNARISNVLSTSFADFEIQDAFQTLDSRGIENTPETRRNLRLDVQKEIIDCNAEIINDFGLVAEQLKRTGNALHNLQETCAALRRNINAARTETAPMLDEANNLMTLKDQVQNKQRILSDFNKHFLLSEDELAALTSSAEDVDDEFFQALVKVKQIHQDSEILLGSENQRLGLEILEECTKNLDAAFQKLFRWAQREFKTLDLEDSHLSYSIRRALRVLAERPNMFQQCLDAFAEVRERSLADAFYVALTGSNTDRETSKPIEFSAHEPLRYVGDMLAWAHSTAVSERESLEVLFISEGDEIAKSIEQGMEGQPWSRPEDGEMFDGRRALSQLVNRNLAGVADLLRQRISQVIATHNEPVLQYKIANLVVFYRTIFAKLLEGEDFMQMLDSLEATALERFRSAMNIKLSNMDQDEDVIPETLESPEFLDEALEELRALLQSYDASAAMADPGGEKLFFLLNEALRPWLTVCERLAASLETRRSQCFVINCLLAAKSALASFSFAKDEVSNINHRIAEAEASLISNQHISFLDKSGIIVLLEALDTLPPPSEGSAAILTHPGFSEDKLLAVRQQLDNFLPSALMDALSDLKPLQNATLSHEITTEAVNRFCADFEKLDAAIKVGETMQHAERAFDDEEPTLRDIFPRTAEETRILLS